MKRHYAKRLKWIVSVIILLWRLSLLGVYGADCLTEYDDQGFCRLSCTKNPHTMSVDQVTCQPEVIFITGARDGFLFTSDMFNNYAKTITHVIIRHVKFTVNEDIAKFASSVFINLKKLERLEILGAKLGDNYAWAIPNSVDTLVFENNSYTSFDASMCPQLTSFAGNINNFTKLPKFPQPAFLTHLYMAYNPLTGLTLQDVGALCLLQTFDLKFVPPHDKYFTNAARHCFCTELKKWCKEYNIGGLYFDCANVTKPNCSTSSNWDEAMRLRNECLRSVPVSFYTIIIGIGIGLLFLAVVVISVIFYVTRFKEEEEFGAATSGEFDEEGEEEEFEE